MAVPSPFRQRLRALFSSGYTWLFLAALLLRGVYLAQALRNNELLTYPVVDARVYVDWAHDFLAGKWLWHDAKTYTPGVPLWLAGWFAVLGERPVLHFAGFLFLGAIQAVVLGKTAELLWQRRAGLATGWLAALYWPLIIFEASYYAEPLAIFSFTLTMYLLVRWSTKGGCWRMLAWAGFCLGWTILARANTMLVAPVLAAWVAWVALRRGNVHRWRGAFAAVCLLALPPMLLCAPIVFWNWRVNGVAELRTGGWLSVFLGNNPEYRGLVVPVGVRWSDFVYLPIRAGRIERIEQNNYWREETLRIVRERPAEWEALMARKAVMLTGAFEVSQEIDIAEFRKASHALSLPVWPGWAVVFPLAIAAFAAMAGKSDARRGWPLALCAVAYFASVAPVQAAARYRLPVVVPMLPLAGWMLARALSRQRDWHSLRLPAVAACCATLLVWHDWLGLERQKTINHQFLIGLKREDAKDDAGAEAAFTAGAAWNPADPDCPYRLGEIWLRRGDATRAESFFHKSLARFPRSYEAMLGLGKCAFAKGNTVETLRHVAGAMQLAPNNLNILNLASRAHSAREDWNAVVEVCAAMRGHAAAPASITFNEARALTLAGRAAEALPLYDEMIAQPWHSAKERTRAQFLGGLLAWRLPGQRASAMDRWQRLAAGQPGYFQMLAQLLTGGTTAEAVGTTLKDNDDPHLAYALAMAAIQRRDLPEARAQLEAILTKRNARDLPDRDRELLEIWALEDLRRAPAPPK